MIGATLNLSQKRIVAPGSVIEHPVLLAGGIEPRVGKEILGAEQRLPIGHKDESGDTSAAACVRYAAMMWAMRCRLLDRMAWWFRYEPPALKLRALTLLLLLITV